MVTPELNKCAQKIENMVMGDFMRVKRRGGKVVSVYANDYGASLLHTECGIDSVPIAHHEALLLDTLDTLAYPHKVDTAMLAERVRGGDVAQYIFTRAPEMGKEVFQFTKPASR